MIITDSLSTTFTAVVLLTRNLKHAEAAVLHGIRSLRPNAESNGELLFMSVAAAIRTGEGNPPPGVEDFEDALAVLPIELRPVLHLPDALRQCFVIRVLAAMPRERCARLLGLEVEEVDTFTCSAMKSLAGLSSAKNHEAYHSFELLRTSASRLVEEVASIS